MTRYDRLEHFIRQWHALPTLREVADACGLDRRAASNLAAALRRHGVVLPPKPRDNRGISAHGEPVDYEALRVLAANLASAAEGERYRRMGA